MCHEIVFSFEIFLSLKNVKTVMSSLVELGKSKGQVSVCSVALYKELVSISILGVRSQSKSYKEPRPLVT